jgi:hypothetical protein
MRQAADGPPTTVLNAIVVKVTRDAWEAMIDQYDRCHSSTSNPPEHQTDEEEAMDAEVEGETEAAKRKKVGVERWAKTMISLNDIEMHLLMTVGEGRTNSQDPKASLHAKQEAVKQAQHVKAEQVAAAIAAAAKKKEEQEARAKEMQESARTAWSSPGKHFCIPPFGS